MVLDTSLLNTKQYKVRIKGKVVGWFGGWVLWHIKLCRLFNAKFCLCIHTYQPKISKRILRQLEFCISRISFVCTRLTSFKLLRAWGQRRTITSLHRTAYFHYFDCIIGDQDKSWAPHICCKPCYNGLTAWFNGKKAAFNFAVPMVWREPRNHADVCYFFLTNITGFNASSRKKIKYRNLRSAMRPVPHSDDLPVPTPPVNKDLLSSSDEEMPSREDFAESISLEDIVYIFRNKWQ